MGVGDDGGSLHRGDVPARHDAAGGHRPPAGRRRRRCRDDAWHRLHDRRGRASGARRRPRRHRYLHDDAVVDRGCRRRAVHVVCGDVGGADRPRRDCSRGAMRARYFEGARVIARTAGMGWTAPIVMSATTFAGSAQFAVASLLRDGGAAAAAIGAAVMLNVRYVPISISVASWFDGPAPKRLLQAQMIVDESWAVSLKRRGGFDVRVLLGAGGLLYLTWTSGTAVGLLLG